MLTVTEPLKRYRYSYNKNNCIFHYFTIESTEHCTNDSVGRVYVKLFLYF